MRIFAVSALIAFVQAATFTTCLTKDITHIGVTTLPGAAVENTDLTALENWQSTEANIQFKLKDIALCLDGSNALTTIQSTVSRVSTDSNVASVDEKLTAFGNSGTSCAEANKLVFATGEYLTKMEITYNANFITSVQLTKNDNTTFKKGTSGDTDETAELSFQEGQQLVGLHGFSSNRFFQRLGAITADPNCVVGAEIPVVSVGTTDEAKDFTVVIVVVAVVVVLLIIAAIVGFCIYKKRSHSKDKDGVEVISVTKTRPQTPPKETAKAHEPAVQVNTDEEDVNGNGNGSAANDDYKKQQSNSLKPDVIV